MAPSPPDEIRARAALPGMTLEIVHRPAGADGPETIGLLIKGAPNLPGMPDMLSLSGPGGAGSDPMSMWLEITRQAWAPWLALWGLSAGQIGPRR
jgi:hypothetical protein